MAAKSTTKEALQKLDTQLECSLCFDNFKEPKLLPCFHVFCKSPCLEKLVAKDGQSLQCPTCRHIVPLPAKGVSGLQSDFHIDHLFEIRDAFNRAAESNETQCGGCEDGKATGYCRDCGDFICDDCQAAHKRVKLSKNHQIVTLEEVNAQATNLIPPKKAVPRCRKHSNKKLKIYCETCRELICSDCTIRVHKDHNYDLVADVFPKHKEEIVSSLKPVKEKLDKVQQALQAFDTRAREISDQRVTVEANIHKEFDQQQRLLDQQRVELIGKLDSLTQQMLKSLAAQRDQVEIAQVKLTSCLEYAEGGLETGTEGQVLAMKAPVLKRIEQISGEFDPAAIQPETKADIRLLTDGKAQLQKSFRECFRITGGTTVSPDKCLTTGDGLKGAEVNKTATADVRVMTNDNKSYNGRVDVTAEITHCKSQTTTKCKVEKKDDKHKISYQPTNRGKHELHIAINSRQVKGSPYTVAVSPSPQSLDTPVRVIEDLKGPWKATTNSNGDIIVTEYTGNRVSVFTSDGEMIHSFGSAGSGNGQFKKPAGVTVDGDDNIYVSEYRGHRIQKFTASGEFLASVGTQGSNNLQFNIPGGLGYNKKNGKLYVCEESNNRVQVLNTDLTFHSSFGRGGTRNGDLSGPSGVSFDQEGKAYIAEHHNNRVQVFTPEGEYLLIIGRDQLKSPLDNAVSNNGVVYVTESTGNRISAFTVTGELIRTLGGKEQFNFPSGITISNESSIVVCDHINGRVLIF